MKNSLDFSKASETENLSDDITFDSLHWKSTNFLLFYHLSKLVMVYFSKIDRGGKKNGGPDVWQKRSYSVMKIQKWNQMRRKLSSEKYVHKTLGEENPMILFYYIVTDHHSIFCLDCFVHLWFVKGFFLKHFST